MPVSQNIKSAMSAAGAAPVFGCRAWVNFNAVGNVEIRAAGNVSSITDNGVGDFTVNFKSDMPDSNYAFCGGVRHMVDNTAGYLPVVSAWLSDGKSSSALRIRAYQANNGATDFTEVNVMIFR